MMMGGADAESEGSNNIKPSVAANTAAAFQGEFEPSPAQEAPVFNNSAPFNDFTGARIAASKSNFLSARNKDKPTLDFTEGLKDDNNYSDTPI